jgi:hypothetical protein
MILYPAPMQGSAIAISILFPLVLLAVAQIKAIRGAGARFALGCLTSLAIFVMLSTILPGKRDPADVLSGCLLLATAMLFWNVIWSLLAFGFTLTLLTALAQAGEPLTRAEWVLAYMKGADLSKFARNRLQLLFGTGMAQFDGKNVVATSFGVAAASLVRFTRWTFGIR